LRVYFDNKGRIREFFPQPIFATSDKVDKIDAYIDEQKPYPVGFEPSITFKRSDSVVLGPFPMLPALDEQGRTYHTYTFNKIDIAVAGPLQISIRYNKYQYDDISDEVIIVKSKATAMITTYVYDVISTSTANVDSLAILYHKIKKIQEELGELESGGDLHHIGDVPPEDYNKYRVWLDYDNEELIEMFADFSNGKLNEDNIIPMAEQLLLSNDNDDDEELINNDNDNEELIDNDNDDDEEQLIYRHEEEKLLL